MKAINKTRLETCRAADTSGLKAQPRRRPAMGDKCGTPRVIHADTHNLDKHHETQTTCSIASPGSGGLDLIGMGDLGHNDCFHRRISARRWLGNRQKVSFWNDLDHLFSDHPTANLLLWDIARTDGFPGKHRRSPASTDRLLARGVGNDNRDGLDHVLRTTGSDLMVSDADASTLSGVRGWNHVGHHINVSIGGFVGHLLQIDASVDALIVNSRFPGTFPTEATS